jgi:hypothetical protein
MPKSSRIVEAAKESYNTIGLAGAVALSAALLNPVPVLAAIVAEAAYLLFVPDTQWYAARLARRYDAEIERQRQIHKQQILPRLRLDMQERFARLEQTRQQIDSQCQEDKTWFREVLRKLDYLLEKFLLFAEKEAEFHAYLEQLHMELRGGRQDANIWTRDAEGPRSRRSASAPSNEKPFTKSSLDAPLSDKWTQQTIDDVGAHYAEEGERLRKSLETETDEATRSIVQKRIDILERRNEFVGKIGRILINLNHQLQLVEDTFGLINDEIRARSPEQILADVEEVVVATDSMASSLQELASVEQMFARIAS